MDDTELANVIAGSSGGPVKAGLLDKSLAQKIGAVRRRVWLSEYTITKNKLTHSDILFSHYQLIPTIMARGFAAVSPGRPRHMVFGYDMGSGYILMLVIKASKPGDTITIESFHRIDKKELRRLIRQSSKRDTLLRNPYSDLVPV